MVFTDLSFLYIFLPLNLILYFSTQNRQIRNGILIIFSLFFYGWGEPIWITLLLFSATIDYFHGRIIENNRGKPIAKWMVISSIVLNLGLLATFKYGNLLIDGLNGLAGLTLPNTGFSLPIGISFYTFQTVSYTIDVYRGEVKAQQSFGKFLLFVSLFHQLVAGPIVRYKDLEQDIEHRITTKEELQQGIHRFILGMGKKVIIANIAGALALPYLNSNMDSLSVMGSWLGAIFFGLQIYFDFSGYSDMAIGLGLMMGFHYHENFNYPYIARSVTDFWRRWHISLGSFFRDYLYIPLGGNRKCYLRNLFIVWFATGLWHGASVNFILWGLYFGIFIAFEKLFLQEMVLDKLPRFFSHLYLLIVVIISWVIFYFESTAQGLSYIQVMLGLTSNSFSDLSIPIVLSNNILWIISAILLSTPIIPYLYRQTCSTLPYPAYLLPKGLMPICHLVILLLCTAMLVGDSYNPFLYFRF